MDPLDVNSSVVTHSDSVASSSCQSLSVQPSSPPHAQPIDPERVAVSKLHLFREKHYGSSEMPLSIEKTLAFLYSQPNMLIQAAQENDLKLLNILLDISIKTQTEEEGDNILHRMAEFKEYISNNPVGGNVFLALAKNRWPEAHKATAEHGKTWTADQWLAFLEDIENTLSIGYLPFNVYNIPSSYWEKITQDWDPKLKQRVFNKLIHLSSVQPSDLIFLDCSPHLLHLQMKENAKTRKEIVTGFIKDDVDIDNICEFFSALERLHNQENNQLKEDREIICGSSSLHHLFFLATHPLAAEFSQCFKPDSWTEKDQWLSILLTLAEHNHGKVVLDQVKSVEIKDADFWTSLLEAASNSVEAGELAELAEEAVPGKIDLKLIQSCKASTEELKKLNAHEWECCAKTKTGHIFRPNYNELTEHYKSSDSTETAFPANVPSLKSPEKNLKPFSLDFYSFEQPNSFSEVIIHSFGTSISNPAQFFLPDPFTLEAVLRAKCRHLRINRFPKNYTSEDAKKSIPLLSIIFSAGIADDRIFIELLFKGDVVISLDKEGIHDSFFHLVPIINELFNDENKYVEYRDQRRYLSREALALIDKDTTLGDKMRKQLLTVLGAMNDQWSAEPSQRPDFRKDLLFILKDPDWRHYFKKTYEGIDLDKLRAEALRVFAPLL